MGQERGNQGYVATLPTIRSQIYSLVWACALPAIIGFALLTDNFYERERTQIKQDTLITARADPGGGPGPEHRYHRGAGAGQLAQSR